MSKYKLIRQDFTYRKSNISLNNSLYSNKKTKPVKHFLLYFSLLRDKVLCRPGCRHRSSCRPRYQKVHCQEMTDKETKKKRWQSIKEEWYSHVHLSLKTLDLIIGIGIAALVITVILMILEAAGIFYLFGK